MSIDVQQNTALNGICPYFTMFPLEFPYSILSGHGAPGDWVMDPFCGRGTTNYASRMLGLPSIGIDSSPVAVALSQAKLANTSPSAIVRAARQVLDEVTAPAEVPMGECWKWACDKDVLHTICRLREGLRRDCRSAARKALRAVLMGALHGPQPKSRPSYLSNQSPRTYAPKPRYAVRFWRSRGLIPPQVDVLEIVTARAHRYYGGEVRTAVGQVVHGDSREQSTYARLGTAAKTRWVITSPPYYGLRTYIPDQWLRWWYLGGPPTVDYSSAGQVSHGSPEQFAEQLRHVWRNVGGICAPGAELVVRFGAINDRRVDSLAILMHSLEGSGWVVDRCEPAGAASTGRRQAVHFARRKTGALEEHDVWAQWDGRVRPHAEPRSAGEPSSQADDAGTICQAGWISRQPCSRSVT
jgi:DNA methylase